MNQRNTCCLDGNQCGFLFGHLPEFFGMDFLSPTHVFEIHSAIIRSVIIDTTGKKWIRRMERSDGCGNELMEKVFRAGGIA
jgi:hypothetical protein